MGISQKGKPGAAGSQGDSLLCGRKSKETDRVHTLFPDEIPEKMWPLPVRNLLFLGKASEQKLLNQGIRTIGDLARHIAMGTDDYMETHFGSYDCEIHSFDDMEEFNMAYSSILKDNDNILIKASHAMKFADIVELLSKDN